MDDRRFFGFSSAKNAGAGVSMLEQRRIGSDTDLIESPRLERIVRYWNVKRGERRMPSRADIDPTDIPNLLSILFLADFSKTMPRIRLLGTEATEACGVETRGRFIHELPLGEFTDTWLEAFSLVVATARPVMAAAPYRIKDACQFARTVLAPLSKDDAAIDHVLGGLLVTITPQSRSVEQPAPKTWVRPVSTDALAMAARAAG
jgi:hypothetical protein